ncbi:hypothetical protein A0H81_11626 [Grifola frondosa]|uniref:Uncharacterized protein n=1 Tax=Grifola frondosa TaxID=5627 RepID=A0A1C7LV23_GRIFR|nr:hypothetical protein A0H81_11626 [Grifola frondosa]
MKANSPARSAQNWAIFQALESCSPPSPSPSCSVGGLAALASSGEIPIFLHAGLDPEVSIDAQLDNPERQSLPTLLAPSTSTGSLDTVGTFGPSHRLRDRIFGKSPLRDENIDAALNAFGYKASPDQDSLSVQPSRGYYDHRFSHASNTSQFTISAYLPSSTTCEDNQDLSPASSTRASPSVSPRASPAGSLTTSPNGSTPFLSSTSFYGYHQSVSTDSVNANDASLSPLRGVISRSWSTISSAIFMSVSPSQSSSTTAVTDDARSSSRRNRFRFPLKQALSRSPSPRSDGSRTPNSVPVTPVEPTFDNLPWPRPRTDSIKTSTSARSAQSTRSSTTRAKISNLPPALDWLRDIDFELWIDQEGFRAIKPTFRLVGYTGPPAESKDAELVNALTHGIADFRPTKRQTSIFHHGTLDPPPLLRRLTMASDESRDYISRQASLTIKANGVYSVCGTELFEHQPPSPHGTAQEALQLKWRFEYVVDGRAETTIKRMGEKTFTPLSFSCSPGLLHPMHGKRIKLMHVLKKNMTPKLSAEKMEAPRPRLAPQSAGNTVTGGGSPAHRRTRSSGATMVLSRTRPGDEHAAKKTRAASIMVLPQVSGPERSPGDNDDASEPARVSRHILSRGELADLLASFPDPTPVGGFQSLRPPRYRGHARASSGST